MDGHRDRRTELLYKYAGFLNFLEMHKFFSLIFAVLLTGTTLYTRPEYLTIPISVFGRPLGLGLCHRKSVRPFVTLVYCGQTA